MSRFNNSGYKKPGYQGSTIALSVKDQYGIEVFFVIKRSSKLKRVLDAYCDRQFVDINSTSFLFNRRSIRGEQTSHELQMEEGDKIHAIHHPSEEHRVQYDQLLAINLSLEEEIIRRRMKSKENVVDVPKSSKEMNIMDVFTNASFDAFRYQSCPLAKDKAPIMDNSSFFFKAGYQSIMGTSVFGKEGGSPPPAGGTEATVRDAFNNVPTAKRSKRKKTVTFQIGPSKRTRAAKRAEQTEDVSGSKLFDDNLKDGDFHHHSGGHYVAKSPLTPRLLDDDKFVPSWVTRNNDTCSEPLVCRERVRGFIPLAETLDVAKVGVKDAIAKIYQQFARMGSLLPYVMDKVQFLRGQSEGFQNKSSILSCKMNVGETDSLSFEGEVVGKVVKKPVRVLKKRIKHIMEKMWENEVIEKLPVGSPTSLENVVLMDKAVEKTGEKVFQGGDTTAAPLSHVPVGGGVNGSSLDGGVGDSIDPTNVFSKGDAGQGGDALP